MSALSDTEIQRARDCEIAVVWDRLGLPGLTEMEACGRKNVCSPWRPENSPSVQVGGNRNGVFDHGSGDWLDVIGLVERVRKCEFRAAVEWILGGKALGGERMERPKPKRRPGGRQPGKWSTVEQAAEYLRRGRELLERGGGHVAAKELFAGYGVEWRTALSAPIALYATRGRDAVLYADDLERPEIVKGKSIRRNDVGKRASFFKRGRPGLWWPCGKPRSAGAHVVVVGGEEKALLVGQESKDAGWWPVSTLAGEGPDKLSDSLAAEIAALGPRRVTIALDADETGAASAGVWAGRLAAAGCEDVRTVVWADNLERGYDVNDLVRDAGSSALFDLIWGAAEWRVGAEKDVRDEGDEKDPDAAGCGVVADGLEGADGRIVAVGDRASLELVRGAGGAGLFVPWDEMCVRLSDEGFAQAVGEVGRIIGRRAVSVIVEGDAAPNSPAWEFARRVYAGGAPVDVVELAGRGERLAVLVGETGAEGLRKALAWGEPFAAAEIARLSAVEDLDARKAGLRGLLDVTWESRAMADVAEVVDQAKAAKVWPLAWLREVAAELRKKRRPVTADRPVVEAPGANRLYGEVIDELIEPVREVLPWYEREGVVVTPRRGRIVEVGAVEAQSELELAVAFTDGKALKPLKRDDAGVIIAAPAFTSKLRALKGISRAPLPYLRDGKLAFLRPGYNEGCATYLDWDGEMPGRMGLDEARGLLDDYLADFCFIDTADQPRAVSEANAVAAMVTLMARGLYAGLTPAFQVQGNQPGIGKGELVKAVCVPILGREPSAQAWVDDDGEMRKRLFAIAGAGGSVAWLDDLDGHIKSPALNMALTSASVEDRVLGETRMASYDWRAAVFLTGNNYSIERDLARRIVPIGLHYSGEDIDARQFRRLNLVEYALGQRREILGALASLIVHWDGLGRPRANLPFVSYQDWAGVVGGICYFAGYERVLENRRVVAAAFDDEGAMMAALLPAVWERWPSMQVDGKQLLEMMEEKEVFSWITTKAARGATSSLGRMLRKWERRVVAGYMITQLGKHPARYEVARV